jgi:uncharacterized protein (TIGR02246 family)
MRTVLPQWSKMDMATSERAQLISVYKGLLKAWNDQNAKAMAAFYASNAAQVGFDGSQVTGSKEIEKHLAPIFRDHPTHRFVHVVREVKLLAEDVGFIRAIAGMVPRDDTKIDSTNNVVQTVLARKKRGKWKIELFQNTPARLDGRPNEVRAMTKELQASVNAQL